jgi:hypothetical protein
MRLVGNMFTDVKFLKDFNFHSSFGVDLNFGRSSNYTPASPKMVDSSTSL